MTADDGELIPHPACFQELYRPREAFQNPPRPRLSPVESDNSSTDSPRLRKTLGISDGIAILIGITIGAGIYSTPHLIASNQSSGLTMMGLWLVAGLFVTMGGLIYAELGTRLPRTGGEYVYISRAFGPMAGFVFGWAQLFIIRTSPAAGLAIIIVDYLQHFVWLAPLSRTIVCVAIILLVGLLNYAGIRRASWFQIVTTIIKVGGLFGLVVASVVFAQGTDWAPDRVPVPSDKSPLALFAVSMMLVVFSYLGWDRVGYSAGEMKNPRRTIPVSIFVGIGVVIAVYLLANLFYLDVLGLEGIRGNKRVASEAATVLFGPSGASLVAILVMISAAGSINGTMMTAPRVYYAMAHDRLFFRWFDFVHPRFGTPSRAIMAHCLWAIVILLVRQNFEDIVAGMVFAVLIFYVVTTLALFRLRRQAVGGPEVFRVPTLIPWIYLAGLVVLIGLRAVYQWQNSLIDLGFVATGIPFAFVFRNRAVPRGYLDGS